MLTPASSRRAALLLSATSACLVLVGCSASGVDASPTPSTSALPSSSAMPASPAATSAPTVTRLFDQVPPIHPSVDGYAHGEVVLISPDGRAFQLPVLLATTSTERQHGLMEVTDLPDGTGMAFLFEGDRDGGFWMFGTHIDIDIAYVTADGAPVTVYTMTPCPEQPCPSYPPSSPYRNTLEVPGGWFDRIGFGLDWTVTFPPMPDAG